MLDLKLSCAEREVSILLAVLSTLCAARLWILGRKSNNIAVPFLNITPVRWIEKSHSNNSRFDFKTCLFLRHSIFLLSTNQLVVREQTHIWLFFKSHVLLESQTVFGHLWTFVSETHQCFLVGGIVEGCFDFRSTLVIG
jgi:hypothetical protein